MKNLIAILLILSAAVVSAQPVSYNTFSATAFSGKNVLQWTTAQEVNAQSFVIERSTSGVSFVEIGVVQASGTKATLSNYEFIDYNYQKDSSCYYRLRQVDFDGGFAYSAVRPCTNFTTGILTEELLLLSLSVYPNPCKSQFRIDADKRWGDNLKVEIYDLKGALCQTVNGYFGKEIKVDHLKESYIIKIYDQKGFIAARSLVIGD